MGEGKSNRVCKDVRMKKGYSIVTKMLTYMLAAAALPISNPINRGVKSNHSHNKRHYGAQAAARNMRHREAGTHGAIALFRFCS